MKHLRAFHGKPKIKEMCLARVREHRAVGCTIYSNEHLRYEIDYEIELEIPAQLAHIKGRLFESLPDEQAQTWPEDFLEAIPVGANLYVPFWQFIHWQLVDPEAGVIRVAQEGSRRYVERIAALYARLLAGEEVAREEWNTQADDDTAASLVAEYASIANIGAGYAGCAIAYASAAQTAAARDDESFEAARTKVCQQQSEKLLELFRRVLGA